MNGSGLAGAGDGTPALPLDGIRVADFFWLIAGPATSRILSDWGADVVKIESEARVDTIRLVGVQPEEPGTINSNAVFADCNTGKRSVSIDLNSPQGIALAKELIAECDVVTNNFTGDRMDRWGLGYEDLRQVRPDLVMLTMPVMGTSGPYLRYGSYGNGVIAYSGFNANMGLPGRPPVGIAPLYSDFSAPYIAASAILAALHHRERTGEGQFIELAQVESDDRAAGHRPAGGERHGATVRATPRPTMPSAAPARTAGSLSPCAQTMSGTRSAPRSAAPNSPPIRASPPSRHANRTRTSSIR